MIIMRKKKFNKLKEEHDKKLTQEIIEMSEREKLQREAELKTLQEQINPHFLYNALDSIRGHALVLGANEVANTVEALSNYFRYNISTKSNHSTIYDELENLSNYMQVQNHRFNNRFAINIELSNYIQRNYMDILIPKMILQPVVENSIKHAFNNRKENCEILVQIKVVEKYVNITISDNGAGINSEKLIYLLNMLESNNNNEEVGIGLLNVKRRLELYFEDDIDFSITSYVGEGTRIFMRFPPKDRKSIYND